MGTRLVVRSIGAIALLAAMSWATTAWSETTPSASARDHVVATRAHRARRPRRRVRRRARAARVASELRASRHRARAAAAPASAPARRRRSRPTPRAHQARTVRLVTARGRTGGASRQRATHAWLQGVCAPRPLTGESLSLAGTPVRRRQADPNLLERGPPRAGPTTHAAIPRGTSVPARATSAPTASPAVPASPVSSGRTRSASPRPAVASACSTLRRVTEQTFLGRSRVHRPEGVMARRTTPSIGALA